MLKWETEEPEIMDDTVQLYGDEGNEEDFECTKMLLIKHFDDDNNKETFTKGYYVATKDEWYDAEGFQLFQVRGWYDMENELNIEQ